MSGSTENSRKADSAIVAANAGRTTADSPARARSTRAASVASMRSASVVIAR